jgi:DNA invertase Pin-like site-specific DNA recombinase
MRQRRAKQGDELVAIAYARASTLKQDTSPEVQLVQVRDFARREGIRIAAEFTDAGVSGSRYAHERPGLVAALAALTEHKAGVLLGSKRDRFARGVAVMHDVTRLAALYGAKVATSDGMTDPLAIGVADVFGEHERRLIAQRTREKLAVKRAKGERLGCLAFGTHAPDGVHVEPHPGELAIVALAHGLRVMGLTQAAIAARLNDDGHRNRAGNPWHQVQVGRLLFIKESTAASGA